jgi:plasmid stabilization system protein ParE
MYSVIFFQLAAQDVKETYEYISDTLKNPVAAENLVLETENKLKGIREFPYSCCLVSDPYLKQLEIRFLLVNNYVAFLRVNESKKEVEIVRFLYGKREWKAILKEKEER